MNRREKLITAFLYSLFAFSLVLVGFGWQEPGIQYWQNKPLEILGFYTGAEPGLPSSESSMVTNSRNITFIAPFFFRIKADGSGIEKWNDTATGQIDAAVEQAHSKNIKVLALVHNLLYGKSGTGEQAAHEVLKNAKSRHRFIGQVLELVKSKGFDGVNIDIETILPHDGNNFSLLIRELKITFAKHDLLVTVCVPAKTRDSYPGQWGQPFDYKEIGNWADRVVVMAYDEHGYSSGPGPIASTPWLKNVIRYSVKVIPRDRILLGVPAYGFDWSDNDKKPAYLSFQKAIATAKAKNVVPEIDETFKAPHFNYQVNNENHQVWFENSISSKYKIELAQRNGLQGIAIWRLGMEDPGVWNYISASSSK